MVDLPWSTKRDETVETKINEEYTVFSVNNLDIQRRKGIK